MINTKIIYSSVGAEQVSYEELKRIPATKKSETHQPIKHHIVVDAIIKSLQLHGKYEIFNETYGISHKGERCFCIIILRDKNSRPDYDITYICRNSNDMAFSLRIGTGSIVGICSNMDFVCEIEVFAKHTKNIMDNFQDRIIPLNKQVFNYVNLLHKKYDLYKDTIIDEKEAHHLIIESVKAKALTKTKILEVEKEWNNPSYSYMGHPNSAWSLFNANTHVNKGLNYADLIPRTKRLHKVFDNYFEVGMEDRI